MTSDQQDGQQTVRWGFLTTGKIARKVAADLALVPGSELVAVGARRLESAEAFVAEHAPGARAHASYADLVADPDVEPRAGTNDTNAPGGAVVATLRRSSWPRPRA